MKLFSVRIFLISLWLACYFPFKHAYVLSENPKDSLDLGGIELTEDDVVDDRWLSSLDFQNNYSTFCQFKVDDANHTDIRSKKCDDEGPMMIPTRGQFSMDKQLVAWEYLGYKQALELFLSLGLEIEDANVYTWNDRSPYNVDRPSIFADEVDRSNTEAHIVRHMDDPSPSFPSYPSGQPILVGATASVLIEQFGRDRTVRTFDRSSECVCDPRKFASLLESSEENDAYSRSLLGAHFQRDSDEGLLLGYETSDADEMDAGN